MLRERRGLRMLSALGRGRSVVVILALFLSLCWLSFAVIFGLLPAGSGLSNRLGGTVAGDFQFFYAAGSLIHRTDAATVYDPVALTAEGRRTLGKKTPELVWPYPPTMSLPLALLGRLSPAPAAAVWIGSAFLAFLTVGRLALGNWRAAPFALICPAAGLALFTGQFSPVLTCALAIFVLSGRPTVRGSALGVFALKPHLGVIAALFSLRRGNQRLFAAAVITGLSIVLLSLLVFGTQPWAGWIVAGARHSGSLETETPLPRYVTAFATARTFGASETLAIAIHIVVGAAAGVAGWLLWTRGRTSSWRALGLTAATVQVVPYALDYDLALLVIPWLLMSKEGYEDSAAVRGLFPYWLALTVLVPASYLIQLYSGRSVASMFLFAILLRAWLVQRSTVARNSITASRGSLA